MPEDFIGKDITPLCLALKHGEARKIESVLDESNINYTFEIIPITGRSVLSIIFGSIKRGVIFLVLTEQYKHCRNLLEKAGLSDLIIE